jgi:regulator of protease activity HflC (stomatin/prohibitin superfamily)
MLLMRYGMVIPGWVLLGLVGAYLIFSFGTLKVGEVGMMTAFGDPIGDIKTGLYFAPALIVHVSKEVGTVFQDELPAEPEKIFRDDGIVPTGMFPPIRVKFGQPSSDPNDPLKDDPYNVAMVAEIVPVVNWHIKSLTTFRQVMGTVANCRKIMADKATEIFADDFAKKTPAMAMLALEKISERLQGVLVSQTDTWGIGVNTAYVKPIIFSHPLNTAVIGVSVARETAKAGILLATGEKTQKIERATGDAEAVRLAAAAERDRLVETGQATADASGKIKKLVPDAKTKAQTDALKALKDVKGTVVLGNATTMLGINNQGGEQ